MLQQLVQFAANRGESIASVSRSSGVPTSTLRDTKMRVEREEMVRRTFGERVAGRRYTTSQRRLILDELRRAENNAEEVSRRLGVSARSVRDMRARQAREAAAAARPAAPEMTRVERQDALLGIVRSEGVTASEAGRRLGVPGRTARRWVRAARRRGPAR